MVRKTIIKKLMGIFGMKIGSFLKAFMRHFKSSYGSLFDELLKLSDDGFKSFQKTLLKSQTSQISPKIPRIFFSNCMLIINYVIKRHRN